MRNLLGLTSKTCQTANIPLLFYFPHSPYAFLLPFITQSTRRRSGASGHLVALHVAMAARNAFVPVVMPAQRPSPGHVTWSGVQVRSSVCPHHSLPVHLMRPSLRRYIPNCILLVGTVPSFPYIMYLVADSYCVCLLELLRTLLL